MRWICTPAGIILANDPVLGVCGRVPLTGWHRRGRGRRGVLHLVQDLRHRRRVLRGACATGLHAHLLRLQAAPVRHPRVGVRDVGAGAGGARLHRRDGGAARHVGLRLRHLPVLLRGSAVLCGDGVLHPVREQLLPDAEERRGHGGSTQVRLLRNFMIVTVSLLHPRQETSGNDVILFLRSFCSNRLR